MKFSPQLSKTHQHFLDQATDLAKMSECKHRHGAVIRKSGRTIAVGINRQINDPAFLDDPTAAIHAGIHAEVAALMASRKVDLNGATIYVARVNKKNEPVMSKPCQRCQDKLAARGVKKVFYTVDSSLTL